MYSSPPIHGARLVQVSLRVDKCGRISARTSTAANAHDSPQYPDRPRGQGINFALAPRGQFIHLRCEWGCFRLHQISCCESLVIRPVVHQQYENASSMLICTTPTARVHLHMSAVQGYGRSHHRHAPRSEGSSRGRIGASGPFRYQPCGIQRGKRVV